MPNPLLEEAIKEAYALAPASVSHIHSIELRHEAMDESLFLVQGYLNRELTLEDASVETFVAMPFDLTLPKTDDGGTQELTLTVDDVDGRASAFCEAAMAFPAPVEIYYRPYLSTDLTAPQMNPPLRLFLLNVTITAGKVSGRAVPVDFVNISFPSEKYNRREFPALGN